MFHSGIFIEILVGTCADTTAASVPKRPGYVNVMLGQEARNVMRLGRDWQKSQ